MKAIRAQWRTFFVLLGLLLSVSACGDGDDGGNYEPFNPLWVAIDSRSLGHVVTTSRVSLYGSAYCDNCPSSDSAFGYCPTIRSPRTSDVKLSWTNLTTGETGTAGIAISGSCSCLFSSCWTVYSNRWAAYNVPLEFGENTIQIQAHYEGHTASTSVVITRIPVALTGLVALAGMGEVTLQWDGDSGATSYNLYWSASADLSKDTATMIAGVESPFRHGGLADNVTYYYAISAVNGDYESALSSIVLATPGWQPEIVGATAATTDWMETSIAVDASGHVHSIYAFNECTRYTTIDFTTYCDSRSFYTNYVTNTSGIWMMQPVSSSISVDANIAVATDNRVHVGYADNLGVTHAVRSADAWIITVVDEKGWCDSSLAVDSGNNPHLVYYASTPSSLEIRYATNLSGSWVQEVVDIFLNSIGCALQTRSISLALDKDGVPHVAYAGRAPDYGLKHAVKTANGWAVDTVDSGYVRHMAVAVDPSGIVHIVYVNSSGQLKYARTDASYSWLIETIESYYATAPAIALDAAGRVHISYIYRHQLMYATNAGNSWNILILDSNAHSGTALVVDRTDKVHISYFCAENLKYVTNR